MSTAAAAPSFPTAATPIAQAQAIPHPMPAAPRTCYLASTPAVKMYLLPEPQPGADQPSATQSRPNIIPIHHSSNLLQPSSAHATRPTTASTMLPLQLQGQQHQLSFLDRALIHLVSQATGCRLLGPPGQHLPGTVVQGWELCPPKQSLRQLLRAATPTPPFTILASAPCPRKLLRTSTLWT